MKSFSKLFLLILLGGPSTRVANACDACALFVAPAADQPGWTLAASEQFTRFGTVWNGSQRLPNPVDQYLDSSITQFAIGYTQGGVWRVQATLPYIHRSYLRPDHADIEHGAVSGIGDATLSGHIFAWRHNGEGQHFSLGLLGGIELPTGNADHLGDELNEDVHEHANFPESGVHGHDLALGSGSTDYLGGVDVAWEHGRWFAGGNLQYKWRRPGKFGYRIADEVSWEAGPGYRFLSSETDSFSAQILLSAEHKGFDTLAGETQTDTASSARYIGLRFSGQRGRHFLAESSIEVPVWRRTSDTMVVPDYRIRASITWRL